MARRNSTYYTRMSDKPESRVDSTNLISPNVCEYIEALQLGSHAIFCYDIKEEVVQVFNSYLKGGIDRNEALRLMTPTREVYSDFLQGAGVDPKLLERDGRLHFLAMRELFADKGPLNIHRVLQFMQKLAQEDRDGGFKGTRVISLSEYYLEYTSPSDLLQFEREIGRDSNLPLTVTCTYDGRKLLKRGLGELLLSLFQHHGRIIGKELVIQNPDD